MNNIRIEMASLPAEEPEIRLKVLNRESGSFECKLYPVAEEMLFETTFSSKGLATGLALKLLLLQVDWRFANDHLDSTN